MAMCSGGGSQIPAWQLMVVDIGAPPLGERASFVATSCWLGGSCGRRSRGVTMSKSRNPVVVNTMATASAVLVVGGYLLRGPLTSWAGGDDRRRSASYATGRCRPGNGLR